jgi:hypothetical protein
MTMFKSGMAWMEDLEYIWDLSDWSPFFTDEVPVVDLFSI